MWAVVLIPMWLRRHDETEESRSVERFTSAMHTLSRREAPADKRYVVMPHRSRSLEVHVSGASARDRRGRLAALAARKAAQRARRGPLTAAARRRRTLLGLLATTLVTLLAAFLVGGSALWAVQFVVDTLLIAFVGHLLVRARRAAPARSSRPATARRSGRAPARRGPARPRPARPAPGRVEPAHQHPMVSPRPVRSRTVAPEPVEEPAVVEPVAPTPAPAPVAARLSRGEVVFDQTSPPERADERIAAQGDQAQVAAEPLFDQTAELDLDLVEPAASDLDDLFVDPAPVAADASVDEPPFEVGGAPWDPVPVPPPTYTTKPTAPVRRPRPPVFEPLLPPVEAAEELDPVDDLEEILDRRWAVND
jgi:hypothetical protein